MVKVLAANGTRYRKMWKVSFPRLSKSSTTIVYDQAGHDQSKQQYEKTKDPKLEGVIDTLDTEQTGIKILMNSLYGALANQYFRYFDLRIAEGITLSGQRAIKCAEKAVNDEMQEILGD